MTLIEAVQGKYVQFQVPQEPIRGTSTLKGANQSIMDA
jgi:hypothetical protein